MILNDIVEIKWSCRSKSYYEKKGYKFTKINDLFYVDIKDINSGSCGNINCKCDECDLVKKIRYRDYIKVTNNNNGRYVCHRCSVRLNKKRTNIEESIYMKNKWMLEYIVNEDDARKMSYGSKNMIKMICPKCGNIKMRSPSLLNQNGFCCDICERTGISYSEIFFSTFLSEIGKTYIRQLGKNTSAWCNSFRYDFYIEECKCIVETHGIQHYQYTGFNRSLEEERINDKNKKELALKNGIKHYIELDCRKSELNWIKNNIMNSELPSLLSFKEEDIDWVKCEQEAQKNIVYYVCSLWNTNKFTSTSQLSKLTNLSKNTISKYLKIGNVVGVCEYSSDKEMRKTLFDGSRNRKPVLMYKNDVFIDEFESASYLQKISYEKFGTVLNSSNISEVCLEKKHSYKGFVFRFKDNQNGN